MLGGALEDWGTKKGADKWCQALLGAFAVRVPEALLSLPWAEHVRNSRNMFVQREQVQFVTNSLLRSFNLETEGAAEFSATFAALCTELLDATLKGEAEKSGEGDEQKEGASASQRQKMRREVLRCLTVLLRTRHKKGKFQHGLPEESCRRLAKVLSKVRDALPSRKGEVFQLCLHVLRALHGKKSRGGEDGRNNATSSPLAKPAGSPLAKPVREAPEGGEQRSGKRAKTAGGQKAAKGFFGDM
jgi:hypothetical protein